jgi:hypothetical protein
MMRNPDSQLNHFPHDGSAARARLTTIACWFMPPPPLTSPIVTRAFDGFVSGFG